MDGRLVSAERLSNATLRTSRGKEIIEHENRLYRKESQGNGLRVHKSGRSASVYYVCCGKQSPVADHLAKGQLKLSEVTLQL